jgi:hypothetical protein
MTVIPNRGYHKQYKVIAVGTTPVQVMADNPARYSILLYNNGGQSLPG